MDEVTQAVKNAQEKGIIILHRVLSEKVERLQDAKTLISPGNRILCEGCHCGYDIKYSENKMAPVIHWCNFFNPS